MIQLAHSLSEFELAARRVEYWVDRDNDNYQLAVIDLNKKRLNVIDTIKGGK